MVTRKAFAQCQPLKDQSDGVLGGLVIEFAITSPSKEAAEFRTVEPAQHHRLFLATLEQRVDCFPLKSAPFPLFVLRREYDDNQVGLIMIQLGQVHTQITTCKLRLKVFVVEDGRLAKALG